MAKISFSLESSVAVVSHLESVLASEVATIDGKVSLIFDDVKEDLALWLLTAVSAYHGLVPTPPDPSPAPINKSKAKDEPDAERDAEGRDASGRFAFEGPPKAKAAKPAPKLVIEKDKAEDSPKQVEFLDPKGVTVEPKKAAPEKEDK